MARIDGEAPSTGWDALQTRVTGRVRLRLDWLELWLEQQRDQLPLWLPVMLGAGIASWFIFPVTDMWVAVLFAGACLASLGLVLGLKRRIGLALLLAGLALSLGCALAWVRSTTVAAPILEKPMVSMVEGEVVRAEKIVARDVWRLTIATKGASGLPPKVRISIPIAQLRDAPAKGAHVSVRARLMPPAPPLIPGGYDFARQAWFSGIGAVGKSLDPPIFDPSSDPPGLRDRLTRHIAEQLPDADEGVGVALVTGDQGLVTGEDADALRASGLAHLLSVSGLHISAVVAGVFLLSLRLLALSRYLALTWPLLPVAAGLAALAGIGYTWLAGAQVPTIRSCIAAILVLIGMSIGREAMTLRLVATGALIVLLLWPEALIGPSFQLSFAAITAIVAFHESRVARILLAVREEGWGARWGRALLGLLLTGLVVEIALMPIALFHFHKAGLYGALANLIAIPLTTFVIMPAEALALLLDPIGLGAPFWWITGQAISLLLMLAHLVAAQPGATALLPSVPIGAFAVMIAGAFWLLLWRGRVRFMGAGPIVAGGLWAMLAPAPDVLITHDGRHVAIRDDQGAMAILRPRSGDFVRQALAERAAYAGELEDLDGAARANCSADACLVRLSRGGREWQILMLRSCHRIKWQDIVIACKKSDITISDRQLPRACVPKWVRIDPAFLAQTGGLAITLAPVQFQMTKPARSDHPWIAPIGPVGQ